MNLNLIDNNISEQIFENNFKIDFFQKVYIKNRKNFQNLDNFCRLNQIFRQDLYTIFATILLAKKLKKQGFPNLIIQIFETTTSHSTKIYAANFETLKIQYQGIINQFF
eukprot:TRINITY_DN29512_c0_g3_i1.p4 TRINITY_DN29512_c0_g3~~TRINITY_DN29512_c0_g3_i1.p4  ORF type:complete len:109 (-),score=0.37 TRINITY_DN29512_c0_g3_i1:444-770(-)